MSAETAPPAPERLRVLVVDDSRILCQQAAEALEEAGFAVEVAGSGEAALALLAESRPDIILLDVVLPGIDGIALCRQLCAAPATREIPVCIMTGRGDLASIRKAYEAGATDFIVKPPSWPVLVQHLRHLLRSSVTARELAAANARLEREIMERERVEAKLRRLSQAVEQSANSVVVTDVEGRIEYANPTFARVTGYALPELVGRTPSVIKSGEHPLEFYEELWRTIKAGKVWHGELHNRRKDGTLYWEDTTIAPVFDPAGTLINFMAIKEDVTHRKLLEQAMCEQRRLAEALRDSAAAMGSTLQLDEVLDRILDNIDKVAPYDAVFMVMVEGEVARVVRQRGESALPTGEVDTRNRYALDELPLLRSLLASGESCVIADTLEDPLCAYGYRLLGWTRSCFGIPLKIRGRVVGAIVLVGNEPSFFTADHAPRLQAFANQASVAIENAQLFRQVHRLSVSDELTGLSNRRHFFAVAKMEYERIRRHRRTLSIAMVDIDFFKALNDHWGHLAGDVVLREVALRVKDSVRVIDIVARYGGEEFVVLMPETSLGEALAVAERVRRQVAKPVVVDGGVTVSATVSIGVAELNEDCASLEDLIKCSDQALYAAKAAGRNRVEAYQPPG